MAKDRAAPFSRKHRRYWIPVLGGMIVIGGLNLFIGICSYSAPPPEPEPIKLTLPQTVPQDASWTLAPSQLPAAVMRAFAVKYPRTIPSGAMHSGGNYTVNYGKDRSATFTADGTFISEN